MKFLLAATVFAAIAMTGCTSEGKATKVLTDQGYTEIVTDGYGWFACSDKDSFATAFHAKSPAGMESN